MPTLQERIDLSDLAEQDRKSRAPRTAGQAGIAGAFFIIFDYVVRGYLDVDLDPGNVGSEMPVVVTAAFTTLATYAVALFMNRKTK